MSGLSIDQLAAAVETARDVYRHRLATSQKTAAILAQCRGHKTRLTAYDRWVEADDATDAALADVHAAISALDAGHRRANREAMAAGRDRQMVLL